MHQCRLSRCRTVSQRAAAVNVCLGENWKLHMLLTATVKELQATAHELEKITREEGTPSRLLGRYEFSWWHVAFGEVQCWVAEIHAFRRPLGKLHAALNTPINSRLWQNSVTFECNPLNSGDVSRPTPGAQRETSTLCFQFERSPQTRSPIGATLLLHYLFHLKQSTVHPFSWTLENLINTTTR